MAYRVGGQALRRTRRGAKVRAALSIQQSDADIREVQRYFPQKSAVEGRGKIAAALWCGGKGHRGGAREGASGVASGVAAGSGGARCTCSFCSRGSGNSPSSRG